MIPAPALPEEARRLAALHSLQLLDTPIEDRFERITRLAQRLFGVSISAVSLIDEQRQWFKSIQGMDALETPRDISFCGHVIGGSEAMVVPNATQDVRFADNPLVTDGPRIGFYAGCPVRGPDGETIGTLCVFDPKPRAFPEEDAQTLRDLALLMEDALAHRRLGHARQSLMEELGRARLAAAVNPVTRLWNAGAIREVLRRELAGGSRQNAGLGVLLVECVVSDPVDGPEQYRQVASRLLSCVRPEDAIGHYAADRFIVIMADCGGDTVRAVCHRVRRHFSTPLLIQGRPHATTLRIGMAWCRPQGEESVDGFVLAAEESLQQDTMPAADSATSSEPVPKAPEVVHATRSAVHKFPPKTVQRIEEFLSSLSP